MEHSVVVYLFIYFVKWQPQNHSLANTHTWETETTLTWPVLGFNVAMGYWWKSILMLFVICGCKTNWWMFSAVLLVTKYCDMEECIGLDATPTEPCILATGEITKAASQNRLYHSRPIAGRPASCCWQPAAAAASLKVVQLEFVIARDVWIIVKLAKRNKV